jgi:F-type H+-transporting ATPase subunit epsilon
MADDSRRIEAEVLTPEGKVYEGELFQLSTVTVLGEVGIRARHVPMLARLVPHELRLYESEQDYNASGGGERFAAAEGWMEVFANKVVVLIGEAIRPDDLDAAELEERKADASRRIEELEEGSGAREVAERDRDRAEAFLKIAGG